MCKYLSSFELFDGHSINVGMQGSQFPLSALNPNFNLGIKRNSPHRELSRLVSKSVQILLLINKEKLPAYLDLSAQARQLTHLHSPPNWSSCRHPLEFFRKALKSFPTALQ